MRCSHFSNNAFFFLNSRTQISKSLPFCSYNRFFVLPLQNKRSNIFFADMKKDFYKCVSKVCAVLLTLLGFTAPITLASCYGPMPDRHYSAEELADSIDSLAVTEADSLARTEDMQAVEEVGAEEGEE